MRTLVQLALLTGALLASGTALAQPWQQVSVPEEAGFSSDALGRVYEAADEAGSAAVVAVHDGRVIAAWGDVERAFGLHSVRKSLVSALYGIARERGEIDLGATLAELGITDREPLTEQEGQAQVLHLITALSGVYLPAAYAPPDQDENRPARDSHLPGTRWFYNNWDFNVAGVIYEQTTGRDLYQAFLEDLARPLGMEDWSPTDGFRTYEPSLSIHPAHTFRMSARDLARFGLLYLQGGRWNGAQVVPEAWADQSTRTTAGFENGWGYGAMWWTVGEGAVARAFPDRFSHLEEHAFYYGSGTGGQTVAVVPGADLVFVHRGDTDTGEGVEDFEAILGLLDGILGARTGEPFAEPATQPLSARPFRDRPPAPVWRAAVALNPARHADYVGAYPVAPGMTLRVFTFEDRLFGFLPGQGEAELVPIGEDAFTVRVLSGVRALFERNASGAVAAVTLHLGPDTIRGERE